MIDYVSIFLGLALLRIYLHFREGFDRYRGLYSNATNNSLFNFIWMVWVWTGTRYVRDFNYIDNDDDYVLYVVNNETCKLHEVIGFWIYTELTVILLPAVLLLLAAMCLCCSMMIIILRSFCYCLTYKLIPPLFTQFYHIEHKTLSERLPKKDLQTKKLII